MGTPGGATPSRGRVLAGVSSTPSRGGAVIGLAATPLRDELGLNTPDAGTPLRSKRAERDRLTGLRDAIRSGLSSLPQPLNEYQLELPEAPDGGGAMDEDVEEDAAEVEARRVAAAEAATLEVSRHVSIPYHCLVFLGVASMCTRVTSSAGANEWIIAKYLLSQTHRHSFLNVLRLFYLVFNKTTLCDMWLRWFFGIGTVW